MSKLSLLESKVLDILQNKGEPMTCEDIMHENMWLVDLEVENALNKLQEKNLVEVVGINDSSIIPRSIYRSVESSAKQAVSLDLDSIELSELESMLEKYRQLNKDKPDLIKLSVLDILRKKGKPMTSTDIVNEDRSLNEISVINALRKLQNENLIGVAGIDRSGKVLKRTFCAIERSTE